MARCFALEEEINFLDPDRWHALLKGPNEKAVLEQQLAKRFQDMKHLSVEDRRAANDKLVLLLNFVRVFVRDPDGFVLNDELTKQTRDVLLALDVHFQRNAGYSAEYCEVLRTTHAARKLPTWMQEPRSEAVVAAKVAGMSVDTRVRGPVRTSPTEAKKTSGAPVTNNHNSSTAGAAGKRDHRRQRREDRKALLDEYNIVGKLEGVPAEVKKKLGIFC
eukprot:PhM_4_TR16744/c1_g1_i11/m.79362